MRAHQYTTNAGPVGDHTRIASLDLVRGVAILGILLMNAVDFRFGLPAYLNLSAGGCETWLDWTVGIFGEIFIDQKFMGLFSMLFGAGIMLFIDRAALAGRRAVLLNLWRNAILLLVGVLHFMIWEGDVLTFYAIAAVALIAMRNLGNKTLIVCGVVVFMLSAVCSLATQYIADASGVPLSGIWTPGEIETDVALGPTVLLGYFLRALGLILVGAGLYRTGFMNGTSSVGTYRVTAIVGLVTGLGLAALGVIVTAANDYSRHVAFIGQVPNTLGTIPASLGYMGCILLWSNRDDSWIKRRLRAVGRMALTNYLTQTILGALVLTVLLGDVDAVNRSAILLFVFAVWAIQFWWSQAWLDRFRFGPAEWLWRTATYRRLQPLRRGP